MNRIHAQNQKQERKVITSKNSPALAKKIKQVSARIMKQNYQLYKDLENK